MQWRLLPPVDGPGAFHMAADAALVESVRDGRSGPVLRFYRWTPACVTLGKFQPVEGNVRVENCQSLGIDIAKRPTGGRAIYHDNEVTFSIIVHERDLPGVGESIMESYRALGAALVAGLQQLGLPAELVDRHARERNGDPTSMTAVGNPACFAAKARCDIMIEGKKVIGCAQMRKAGVILQQNSLPLAVDFPRWDEVFYRSDWQAVMQTGAVDLWTAAHRQVAYDEVFLAICAGFASALEAELCPGELSADERARTLAMLPEYDLVNADGLKV